MNSQDKVHGYEIAALNSMVKVRLAPSKVHSVGVFAIRDIFKGEKIYADYLPKVFSVPYSSFGKLFPEVKQLILERWPRVVVGEKFAWPTDRTIAYMNHSEEPNYNPGKDEALVNIKAGEELFENYFHIPGWEVAHPWLINK